MLTSLRLMFVSHDWSYEPTFDTYTCTVCGRREKPDHDDGVNLTARYLVWPGAPKKHLAQPSILQTLASRVLGIADRGART